MAHLQELPGQGAGLFGGGGDGVGAGCIGHRHSIRIDRGRLGESSGGIRPDGQRLLAQIPCLDATMTDTTRGHNGLTEFLPKIVTVWREGYGL
jgi:hypothetical protein